MKRLLFVDDEPRILQGLKRMLRSQRACWEMEFLSSSPEALRLQQATPFDVVVADMRMPEMDGAALLSEVKEHTPDTIRIILSGYSDMEAAMRSVTVSHQYLAKPCEPTELKAVLQRAIDLGELLQDERLIAAARDVGDLPVVPRTYQELVQALSVPEPDVRKVAAVLERDSALTAKMLQLVNSSYFGLRREVNNVTQAATFLGTERIRGLVLTAEVFRQFSRSEVGGLDLEREQEHSLLTSRLARSLVTEELQKEDAALAGLLHGVGKLVLASGLPDTVRALVDEARREERPLHVVEEARLTAGHAELGAYLLGLWGLPYTIVEAVAFQHHPSRVAEQHEFGVLAAVHVAGCLAHELADTPASARPALDLSLLRALGVEDRLPAWREQAQELLNTTRS